MSVDKAKAIAETVKIAFDIVSAVLDRREKQKAQEKRIAELEAENARLRAKTTVEPPPVGEEVK